MRRSISYIEHVQQWAKTAHNLATARLCQGFQKFQDRPMTKAREIFEEMGDLTTAIDNYLQGRPRCLKLGVIAVARFAVQHRLMCLPRASETYGVDSPNYLEDISERTTTASNQYEACIAAVKIYSIAVTFPVPNARRIMQQLVERLKQALVPLVLEKNKNDDSDLFLWMLVLGGVAALQSLERVWFIEQLEALVREWVVDTSWTRVERIMKQFLWLDSACGQGGKMLWAEVMSKRAHL